MRILLITAAASWSGVEVHTVQLASALKEKGHDVVIVELGRQVYSKLVQPPPCPVLNLELGPDPSEEVPLDSFGIRKWLRIFGNLNGDVAISVKGNFKFGSLTMEAALRSCFPCFMVIEHMHVPLSKREKSIYSKGLLPKVRLWWYRQRFSGYLRSVFPHKILCVSHALLSTLREDYSYPLSKMVVSHSGVNTDIFYPNRLLRNLAERHGAFLRQHLYLERWADSVP